jgi:hypothetical protein
MDKITELSKRLKDIKDSFYLWQKSGLNEEVLIIYLSDKTHLPKKAVKNMLNNQKEFFDKLIKSEVVKRLEGVEFKKH